MTHINCSNKFYIVIFHKDFIEINIINIPTNNYIKVKIYFDIVVYYQIENTVVKLNNGKIFNDEYELKTFFKLYNNINKPSMR